MIYIYTLFVFSETVTNTSGGCSMIDESIKEVL